MNRKLLPAISVGIAVLIFGSIAYAAERRRNTKTTDILGDKSREEELLKAELLKNDDEQAPRKGLHSSVAVVDRLADVPQQEEKKEAALLAEVSRRY